MNGNAASGRARPNLRVHTAGEWAGAVLRGGMPLEVTAVFDKSFYCRDAADRWLCFLRDGLEAGPLHALCGGWPASLGECVSPGQTFAPDRPDFLTGPGLHIRHDHFTEWRPPEFPRTDWPAIRRVIPGVRDAIRLSAPPHTVAALVVGAGGVGNDWRRTAAQEAVRGLAMLSGWLASPAAGTPDSAVQALLGLGPGLTPTGDDILAGSLLTLHALGHVAEKRALAAAMAERAPEATNRISLAHLRAAAAGQGAAPFHDLLTVIMNGRALPDDLIRRIGAIGHTSGWDVLMGVVATIEARS